MRSGALFQLLGGALAGAALVCVQAEPALAWGPLTHGAMAQRSYAILVTRHPWLAPHREAYLWGALAADFQDAPGAAHLTQARTHGDGAQAALWRDAGSAGPVAKAFVLGWVAHAAADEARAGWLAAGDDRGEPRNVDRRTQIRAAIAAAGTPPPPSEDAVEADALLDLAVDAAVLPKTDQLLRELALSAWHHTGTPAGAPLAGIVQRVLGVDEPAYTAMAGLTAAMAARGPDRYLAERARFGRVERWLESARSATVRAACGDMTPVLTQAATLAVERVEALLAADAKSPTRK